MTDLSISNVLDVDFPGVPEWSADGRFVAALVYEDDGNALYVADTRAGDDRNPRDFSTDRVSPGEGHVTDVAWAPESRPAAFVLTTDEGETYRGDAAEGTTELVSRSPEGEAHHEWSNGGASVAFYRDGRVCVRDADRRTERTVDVPGHETFLAGGRVLAWDDADDRLAFSFTDRSAWQVGVVDVASGDLLYRTEGPASRSSPAWLADGRLVVERVAERGTVRSLVAVDPESGDRTELLTRTDDRGVVSAGPPTVSPDGTRLAAVLPVEGYEHVVVIDPDSGERRALTAGAFEDKGVAGSSPQWVDDGTIAFASNRRDPGQRGVFAVDATTGEVTPLVTSPGTNVYPRPSPDGDRVAYVHADRERSPELRVASVCAPDAGSSGASDAGSSGASDADSPGASDADSSGTSAVDSAGTAKSATRLTRSAVDDWPVDPIPPEAVTYESDDGTEVHGYLLDPRKTDAVADDATDLPAVVWVHGGPMRQMRDGWHPSRSYGLAYTFHQYLARRGFVGLFVNYRGGIGYGTEFRQALADGYGRDEMADVAAGAAYLRNRAYTSDAVGVWGLSYGGYATLQLLGTHPDAFDVGVNLAGLADLRLYEDWAHETKFPPSVSSRSVALGGTPWEAGDEWDAASPKTHFGNYEAPLYNFHGTDDAYVNFEQLDVVIDGMLEHGNEYEAEYFPDETHVFSERATWARTLGKVEAAFDEHLR